MKNRYLNLYIISVMMINTIAYYPYIILSKWEKGFPFAILLGFLIVLFITVILIKSYNRFEGLSLVEISKIIYGKNIGTLICIIFILVCLSECFLLFISSIVISRKLVMVTTPPYVLSVFIIIVIICCLKNTEKTVLIVISYFTYIIIVMYPLILGIIIRDVDFRFMEGAIRHSLTLPPLPSIAFGTFFFAGIENLALYNTAFKKTNISGPILIYLLIGIPVAFLTILLPIGIWGDVAVKFLNLPTLITNDAIAVDLFLIERALFIVFPIYFTLSLIGTINYAYVSFGLLRRLLNNSTLYIAVTSILLLIFVIASRISDSVIVLMDFAEIWGVFWLFFLIIFSLTFYFFSKRAVKNPK